MRTRAYLNVPLKKIVIPEPRSRSAEPNAATYHGNNVIAYITFFHTQMDGEFNATFLRLIFTGTRANE